MQQESELVLHSAASFSVKKDDLKTKPYQMLNILKYLRLFGSNFKLEIRPVLSIIFIFFIAFSIKAQENLIYNGSFEEYYSCPTGNDLNDGQLEKCKGWWKPTYGTSDYFNACNNSIVGVPSNFWGYQEALQGNAYVGFGACSWDKNTGVINDYSEYIQSELTKSLKSCYEYKFTMYVCLSEYSTYAMKSIGTFFSLNTIGDNFDVVIDTLPQVVNKDFFLKDSINWMKIEKTFIAHGGEKYITIGYFLSTIESDTLHIHTSNSFTEEDFSYYYIDNVSLIEIGMVPEELCNAQISNFPNIITPNNDGVNDLLNIEKWASFQMEISILNRWGNEITVLNKKNPIWDGNGCTDGIYYYIIKFKDYEKQQTGFIQLVR